MTAAPLEVVVGKVGRPHGLAGAVLVDVRTDEPDRRFAAGTVFDTPKGRLEVDSTRRQGRRLVVAFSGVVDRDGAERLRGLELRLTVAAEERPDDPEEFYDHQLVGLDVAAESGEPLGTVIDVLHLPAQDVLVVAAEQGERLVPFVRALVPAVDLDGGRIVVVVQAEGA